MKRFIAFITLLVIPFTFLSPEKTTSEVKQSLVDIKMVYIPAGKFTMGSNRGDDDEKPVHKVYLNAYYISKYEITQAQYKKFIDDTGHRKPNCKWDPLGKANYPVVCLNWHDAAAFCKWAGGRLPKEAEWEKAARGTDKRRYPWGNKTANCKYAVMNDGGGEGCGTDWAMAVGSKPRGRSPYGVHDMAGNVWEWCADWYDENYYKKSPLKNPKGPGGGSSRVLRGGGWYSASRGLRCTIGKDYTCSHRFGLEPSSSDDVFGFRMLREKNLSD